MSAVARVGPEAFEGDRLRRAGTWGVAFLADWCPFCQAFAPGFLALAGEGNQLLVGDITSEESPLWDRFAIATTPMVIVFRDGEAVQRFDSRLGRGFSDADLEAIRAALHAANPPGTSSHRPARAGR